MGAGDVEFGYSPAGRSCPRPRPRRRCGGRGRATGSRPPSHQPSAASTDLRSRSRFPQDHPPIPISRHPNIILHPSESIGFRTKPRLYPHRTQNKRELGSSRRPRPCNYPRVKVWLFQLTSTQVLALSGFIFTTAGRGSWSRGLAAKNHGH